MKKFFYLPVLAILFASCSTDNDSEIFQEDAVVMSTVDPSMQRMSDIQTCISSLAGTTMVDVSGGFENPQVVFIADVANGSYVRTKYTLSLEMQLLTDCEDLTSGSGAVTRFSLYNISLPSLNDPKITLSPSQLPSSCYRWRYVVEGSKTTTSGSAPCLTVTPWYEEPLF